ncbi:pyrroloquinoline-quinone synthase PqqC [Dactylosporangium salmoneum]|uniref:Pyrroloquinoline-quinone synthase n=1 Tax=Dactylosporangium salmoneum TaxID=53361 RepID=A0ABN3H9K2_9ACTN
MADEHPLSREDLAATLRGLSARYWDKHPFHVRLHAGGCSPDEVRAWVANRWYYQRCLSQKNAAIIASCPLPEVRRRWVERIAFQDGSSDGAGGLQDWLVLAEAVGLDPAEVRDERRVLPGVRFAVDGYVNFCRTRPWTEGAAAALTELFSPDLMADRIRAWQRHYDWIKPYGFAYFENRIPVVRRDSQYTLSLVLDHCRTREQQDAAVAALSFKCDVLRAILDAVDYAGMRR